MKFYGYCVLIIFSIALIEESSYAKEDDADSRVFEESIEDHDLLQRAVRFLGEQSHFTEAFNAIAIPRVVGTPGHKKVQKYLKNTLSNLGWTVEEDKFTDHTPLGRLEFNNIIATPNPNAAKFLDLACHYDSKYFKKFEFIAATDSAAPCAIMISLAYKLNSAIKRSKRTDLALRLIFFDGEEAFVHWTETDSLYGSRHLAEKWAKTPYPEGGRGATQLSRMELLVLLDLLGAKSPSFFSFFKNTQKNYVRLLEAESALRSSKALFSSEMPMFRSMSTFHKIDDDHVPFMKRQVPILHLIPVPFPDVWHKKGDNKDIIDMPTVTDLTKIIGLFVAEHLNLDI